MINSESIENDIITKMEKELLNAMKNCNVKKLDQLLHGALLFNIPSGETTTKSMDLDTYRSGNMRINQINSLEQQINLIGDNAIVSAVIDMKGMYFDYSLDGKYKIIRVWKLFHNNWKVIAGSSIAITKSSS